MMLQLSPKWTNRWLAGACLALVAVVGSALISTAVADETKLDKPVRVATAKTDKSRVVGRVSAFNDTGFTLLDDKDAAQTVKWSDLPPKNVMELYGALLVKGTAKDWVNAGHVMYFLPDGKDWGERAFARALRADPKLKDLVEVARKTPPATETATASASPKSPGKSGEMIGEIGKTASQEDVLKHLWGKLTDDEQAASVKYLKDFAEKTRKGKDGSLKLIETKYFLFYSDLKPEEAKNWASLLDRMYARLAELFAVPKDSNIWRGKGLIFVYAKPEDYHAHESLNYQTDSQGTAGMCHSFSNGYVHVAFYRQKEELMFAHILVHESVHGFIHRYRSWVRIPSWANEGLAEVIAAELVPQKVKATSRRQTAVEYMRERGVGQDFFVVEHIAAWQYPVAENMCAFMIAQNKTGYVKFINGVKDGQSVEESLEKNYGAPEDRIAAAFLDSCGIKPKKK